MIVDFMNIHHITTYDETTGEGLLRHVLIRYGFRTWGIMVCLIINGDNFPKSENWWIICVDSGHDKYHIKCEPRAHECDSWAGDKGALGTGVYYRLHRQCKIPDFAAFILSVNPVQTENLYGQALEYAGLHGNETVWDLYCGIGTISLFLAQKAKQVYGVEIIPQAIEDAKRNAALNGN